MFISQKCPFVSRCIAVLLPLLFAVSLQAKDYYSTDGENFVAAGESFPMRAGFWKGIRVGLFCYSYGHNMSAGRPKSANKAYFDSFEQKINQ